VLEIDKQLGWRLRPGANAIHSSRDFQARYTINRFGYRDGDRHAARDRAKRRLLLYGDSQAFGWGLQEAQRFSNLVEARGDGLEVWNLAVPGYGLDQEILSYERDGGFFSADDVVLLVSVSTLYRLPFGYVYKKYKPRFVLEPGGRLRLVPVAPGDSRWTSLLYEAFGGLYLPHFVEYQLAAAREAASPEFRAAARAARKAPDLDLGNLERSVLERAHALALARGHRLTLLVDLPQSLADMKARVRSFCEVNAIGYLEIVLPPDQERLVLGEHDGHWNQTANSLIAEEILSKLRAKAEQ
jgi:hypothetical protein